MKLSYKDKSLLMFMVALFIVFYSIFNLFLYLFKSAPFTDPQTDNLTLIKRDKLINISKPLSNKLLKDKIIVLDFWNSSCISCLEGISEMKKLQERFGNRILLIGVHSSKFQNEKRQSSVKKSVIKHDITYPVINDDNLKLLKHFEIKTWPTVVLLSPKGKIYKKYQGNDEISKNLKKDIKKLIDGNKFSLNRKPVPLRLAKNDTLGNVLFFPSKISYAKSFTYKNHKQLPALFISNAAQNNIIVSTLSGKIITKIGSGDALFDDGDFITSSFNMPHGLVFYENKLFVADTGNHAIRIVDFTKEKVSTLLGNGQKGSILSFRGDKLADKIKLYFPSDIDIRKNSLIIANLGSNQILSYNLKNRKIAILAGNGESGNKDGKYPDNLLSKPSGISVHNDKIYFLDSATSTLRVIDKGNKVKTLIGNGKELRGFKDGDKKEAMLQNPLGLDVDETGIYITDSFNHSIRKYSFSNKRLNTLTGGRVGEDVGAQKHSKFDEPNGIFATPSRLFIVDSNNNRIIETNRSDLSSKIIDIIPQLKLPKKSFLEYLPNLQYSEKITLAANQKITIDIDISKNWKLNDSAPSFINLLRITDKNEADLVASFDWQEISLKKLKLPALKNKKRYILQGVIYHCENRKNALCFIKSYEKRIVADKSSKNKKITVKLGK
ncbi:MAG: redoxin domain-containing protein [Rickettsiales bacterium]|nr:redoxin domain-containing protein [Rickettsiales bacterium]